MTQPAPASPSSTTPTGVKHHTHPLTPLVASARSLGIALVMVLAFGMDTLSEVGSAFGVLPMVLAGLAGLLVLMLVAAGFQYLAWQRTVYYFDVDGDFRVDSGILQRQERRVALSRLQTVDITRPLLGRIVGLSQVRIEVAGGGDSRVVLSYLADPTAQALRTEIIARAAGVDPGAGEAPEAVLATVPPRALVVSLLLRSETILLAAFSVLLVTSFVLAEGASGLMLLLVTGGLPLLGVFSQFSRFFGFTVADSPDGLRLRHGLINAQSQTVPPGRVQALEIAEPLLWRRRGWVRVSLNVAGLQSGQDEGRTEHVLLPVAPHDVARAIIGRVLPGVTLADLAFAPAPRAARFRAWLQWPNLGVAFDDRAFATRRGFLTRRMAIIPHARTQSVEVKQGPWQRLLGLATIEVDTTPGPVVVEGLHRAAAEARAIAEAQLLRAAAARASGPPERWMAGGRGRSVSSAPAGPDDAVGGAHRADPESDAAATRPRPGDE